MLYSEDWNFGLSDLKIKLPLLGLPLVVGTSKRLTIKQFQWLLVAFIGSVAISTFISIAALVGILPVDIQDNRDLSLFISHIRFALYINIAIVASLWLARTKNVSNLGIHARKIFYSIAIWFILFLLLLQALTGIVTIIILGVLWLIKLIIKSNNKWFRVRTIAFISMASILATLFLFGEVRDFYPQQNANDLPEFTPNGNLYLHNTANKQCENGNYIYLYLSDIEIYDSWNKRSNIKLDINQSYKPILYYTIIRYLTSKGLHKDSQGISKLTDVDIRQIEGGMANYRYTNKFSLRLRIYKIIWQINSFLNNENPSGHSITQRFVAVQFGFSILADNLWCGVGTGDTKHEYKKKYDSYKFVIAKNRQIRAHNQLLTFAISFGILGFLWICFAILRSIFIENGFRNILFVAFFIVAILSMLNEDTLESQAGITFFTYFWVLFLYAMPDHEKTLIVR